MRSYHGALLAGAAFLFTSSSLADDSSAALGAGGVVLTKTASIRMTKEDLYVSPSKVRVRFKFFNDSRKAVDTIVAFSLPDIDARKFYIEPLGHMTNDPVNFVGFSVIADGRRVTPHVEQRAFYKGKDVTAILASAHIPVNVISDRYSQIMQRLSPEQVRVLERASLSDHRSGDGETPHWIVRTRFWWRQDFPAGKTVIIEHSYHPVTGQSFFLRQYVGQSTDQYGAHYIKTYCIDAATRAAIAAHFKKQSGGPRTPGVMIALATDYVLKSANNWNGPIGRFRLVLDKLKPDNFLSLCWSGALKKTGPTTFEAVRNNFAPTQNIKLLVLQNGPPGG